MWRLCSQFINSGIHDAINKCSSKCFSIFYDYTKVHDLLCDGISLCKHGLNVSMAVWQLPCDKVVVFFAREMYISNLRSPGVTNRSEMKVNQIGSEQTVSRDSFQV